MQVAKQEEHENDDQHQSESTGRIVAPTTRVGPRGHSRNQQNQHDQEQYHVQSDGLGLENITAVEYYSAAPANVYKFELSFGQIAALKSGNGLVRGFTPRIAQNEAPVFAKSLKHPIGVPAFKPASANRKVVSP